MKKKYLLILCLAFFASFLQAQTTEDFETETAGSTSFTDNGQVFNVTTQSTVSSGAPLKVYYNLAQYGWSGTANDYTFLQNSESSCTTAPNPIFTISSSGLTAFNLQKFYIYLAMCENAQLTNSGTMTVTGKLGGVTQYTATLASGTSNIDPFFQNGYTLIDLSTLGGSDNSNKAIDEFVISTNGSYKYAGFDAMTWQKITCPAVVVTQASQTNVACNGSTTGAAAVNASGGTGLTYEWSPGTPTGDGTASVTGLSAGTWTCKVTNSCGSSNLTSFTISQPTALVATAAAQTNVSCNGVSNGSATVSASNGTPGYSYSWAPSGGTAATATGLSAGIHTVTVTDANGCTATKSFTITQPTAINLTPASQTNVSCNGGSNGAATVNTPTGGTGGYTYNWTPGNPTGDGTASVTGLIAGAWTCTVTDANACTTSQSFIISQPSGINLTPASQTNIACFGGSTGAAAINTPTGGAGGYTYNWSPGTPTGDGTTAVTGLTAGTWTCTVTDANGCTKTQNFTVTQPPAITITPASQTNIACFGGFTGAAAINTPTGGTGGYTYNWTPGNPTGDGTTAVSGLTAGTWTCTVTDANACTTSQSFTITQPSPITLTPASQTNIACFGGSTGAATVNTPTGGAGGYTYNWTPGNPTGDGTATVSGLTAGTWTCTVTDANACTASQSFTITQQAAIVMTPASQTNISCNGASNGAATVNTPTGGAGGYTYNWTPGNPAGDGTTAVTGLTAGTWTCTVTDANACTTSQSFTITQPSAITLTPASQTNIACFGGSTGAATVNNPTGGAGGYTYNWTPGNPTGDGTASVSGLTAGTWTCTVTDANACTTSQSFTITQPAAMVLTPASQTNISCNGGSTGTATVNIPTGGAGGYTYNWTPGNPTGDGTAAVSGLTAGTWTCTVTDANACTTSQSFTITQPSAIALTPASQTNISCNSASNGAATVNTPTGGAGGYTYNWTPGNPAGDGTKAVTGLTAGTWTCTVTDANSCTASQSFTITEPTSLTANITTQTNASCNGSSDGSATVAPSGGTPGYIYSWAPVGGTAATATGLAQGNYAVTITDANNCSVLKFIYIGVNPDIAAPVADVTTLPDINSYCSISSVEITVPTATDNCSGSISATTSDPLDYTSEGNYVINWNYNDGNGNSASQTQKINILASPLAIVSLSDSEFTYDGNLHAIQVENLPPGANVTYAISPANGSGNGAINAGSYAVTATVTPGPDAINCGTVVLTATLSIIKASQQITFNPIPAKNLQTDSDFNLSASSNSNLPVYYTYISSPVTAAAITSEGAVTILGSGQVTILAHQDGNTNYLPANNVSQVMIINSNNSNITKITIGNQTYDNPSEVINYVVDCGESDATITIISEANTTVIPANNLIVKTPQPGIYKQTITVTSQDGSTTKEYTLIVEKQFDFLSIVTQKFDNILLVNNNPLTNGGYEFISYEWYKNNQLIGTNQYYSAGDDKTNVLDATGEYYVKMTTVGGEILQSCSAKISGKLTYQAKLYPNPVQEEKIITVEADFPEIELEQMQISIYSISGKLIKTLRSSSSKTQIQLPPTLEGNIYFVVLETPNIKKSLKVIVNK